MTEPLRPIGSRPAVAPPGALERATAVHRRHPDEDPQDERGDRRPPRDEQPGDDTPGADGHIDVLA